MKTDNELIAEFMDVEHDTKRIKTISGWKYFQYDTSWSWLMPVVGKITPLSRKFGQREWLDTAFSLLDGNIQVVYERTVQFIKWYNTNIITHDSQHN